MHSFRTSILLSLLGIMSSAAMSQAAPQLPSDPGAWINSRPLSLEALKGKAVIFYFFEEQCPNCIEKWPPLLVSSAKYQGEPVVFIAVNSGNSRRTVESYARKVQIPWPIIVDSSRSLEKAFDFTKEISLEQIYAIRVVRGDGKMVHGNPSKFEETITQSLNGAAWKIDPKTLPAGVLSVWKEVELGDYQRAYPLLKKPLASRDEETRTAAEQLLQLVTQDLETDQAAASQAEEEDNIWEAYKIYSRIALRFKGFEGSEQAVIKAKSYARHEKVKAEQDAFKKLAVAQNYGNRGDERSVNRAISMLEGLIEEYPETEASLRAQEILAMVKNPLISP